MRTLHFVRKIALERNMIEKYQIPQNDSEESVKYERMYRDDGHLEYMNEVYRKITVNARCLEH